jgi:hypothetical protein
MLKPEKKLRWLGIDMRARWRRRAAVLVTYLAFIAVVSIGQSDCWGHPFLTFLTLVVPVAAVQLLGVFSPFGPVKPFDDPPPGKHQSKYVYVHGLDDLARYRYDVANYDAATPEQQSDLIQTYHVGLRLYPRKPSQEGQVGLDEKYWLDEREKSERIEAQQWARRLLMFMIAIATGPYLARHSNPTRVEVVGDLFLLYIFAWTLPAARILWTEADPRDTPGEIELVPGATHN